MRPVSERMRPLSALVQPAGAEGWGGRALVAHVCHPRLDRPLAMMSELLGSPVSSWFGGTWRTCSCAMRTCESSAARATAVTCAPPRCFAYLGRKSSSFRGTSPPSPNRMSPTLRAAIAARRMSWICPVASMHSACTASTSSGGMAWSMTLWRRHSESQRTACRKSTRETARTRSRRARAPACSPAPPPRSCGAARSGRSPASPPASPSAPPAPPPWPSA